MPENTGGNESHGNVHTKKGFIDKLVTLALLGKSNAEIGSNPDYQVALPELRKLYDKVWRWHGTGRYHYHNDQVADVLKEIIQQDGLTTHRDPLDYTRGVMYSISTSPSRTYSSLYAQLHYESGKKLRNAFQTSAGWIYYMSSIAWAAARHDRRLFSKKMKEEHFTKENVAYFHKKYTKADITIGGKEMMLQGGVSDIAGNYPILIGIQEGAFQEADIARVLRKHESRSETPISISDFTHIEVPMEKIEEVRLLLEQGGKEYIPVIPLEWGEEFSKSLSVSFLKDGIPLKRQLR